MHILYIVGARSRVMKAAPVLRVFGNHEEVRQTLSGKFFGYFGAARPILAIGGSRGVLTEVLEETRAGIHALSKQQLLGSVIQMYIEFRREDRCGTMPIECTM